MQSPHMIGKRKRGRPAKRRRVPIIPYIQCKQWIQSMGFRNATQYYNYTKLYVVPPGTPVHPAATYKDEYEGDPIFYGTRPPIILTYNEAQKLCLDAGVKTSGEYTKFRKMHNQGKTHGKLPTYPYDYPRWKDQWVSYGEFLKTGSLTFALWKVRLKDVTYEQAKSYVHQFNLQTWEQWKQWSKTNCPPFLTKWPERRYAEQFSTSDWLGTDINSRIANRVKQPGCWALIHDRTKPNNEFLLKIFPGGSLEAKWVCKRDKLLLMRIYKFESELKEQVEKIIKQFSLYYDPKSCEITATDINQLRYNLDNILLIER
jgi:hypothetical protein